MDWTADRLTQLATGYWQSATLNAAVELRLFDALDDESCTAEELAARLGLAPTPQASERLAHLLDALTAMGLVAKYQQRYRIAAGARPLLSRSSPTCMLDALAYNVDLYHQWSQLGRVVRSGEPAGQQNQLGNDPELTRRFVYGMESKARAYTPTIAPLIRLDHEQTLLDIGSGPGTLSRALAERAPQLQVTLLDLPPVLAVARQMCDGSPVAGRLRYHPADYRRDALPGGFDAALYAGALHQETLDSAQNLFNRIAAALRPGGRLFVMDLMLDDHRTSPTFSTLFQLTMLLIRPVARVFSRGELFEALQRAGFDRLECREPESSPYRVVTACKGAAS